MYAYLLSLCLTCVSYKVFTLPLYKYILRGLSHAMNKQQETSQHLYLYTRMFPVCFTMVYHRFNVDEEPPKDPNSSYRRLFKNVSGQRAMGLFGQFLQLLWKNVILRKRQKVSYFSYIYLKPKR